MINIKYPATDKKPPSSYSQVTYAYDLLSSQDKKAMIDECKRLEKKGDKPVVYYFDTRGENRKVRVACDAWTRKAGVFGEIWREER